ncbi:MAG: transposase, partial [Chloroflexota bacterium]
MGGASDQQADLFDAQILQNLLFFLEFYADLSDVELAEQCRYNLLFRSFIGLPLSGPTPDDTTLVVFRRRLGPERFRRLFDGLVEQCRDRDLLSGKLKIVDATHVLANVAIPNTVNLLREARKRLVTAIEADGGVPRPDLRQQYETDEYIRGVPTQDTLLAEHTPQRRAAGDDGRMFWWAYERKRIERKFGQAKTNHGLGRARYLGLAK